MSDSNVKIFAASVTDRGLSEKRPQNEDSCLVLKEHGLFAVADGVGGAQAGDVASEMAMEMLGEAFANLRSQGDAEEMMKIAIERANGAIHQMQNDLPQLSTMATTIVALHIDGQIATIGHVGDSRLYRLDTRGNLYRETQDHSVVEEEVRAGRLTAAQAANHPSRNVISRALGAEPSVEVDLKTIMFDANTTFLLCSDGVTRHIPDLEIRELLVAPLSPEQICAKIKEICYSRGAEDNLTAVVVRSIETSATAEPEPVTATAAAPVQAAAAATFDAPDFDDESTISTARPPITEPAPEDVYAEPTPLTFAPTAAFAPAPGDVDDEAYLMDEQAPASQFDVTAPIEINPPPPASEMAPTRADDRDFTIYADEPQSSGGGIVKSLLFLLVGIAIGGGGIWYYLTSVAPPAAAPAPQISEMKSSNPPFTAYENVRREIEGNPEGIIKQYESIAPADAADFYLLGKAFLYTKRYEDAKKNFLEARNRLKDYPEATNKPVLTSDIAIGLAITDEKAAQSAFEKERSFSAPAAEKPSNANK